jgi:hypothetical protein
MNLIDKKEIRESTGELSEILYSNDKEPNHC